MEPSLRISLKGLNRARGHESFILGPFDEGKSLRLVMIGIDGVSKTRERIRFVWLRVVVFCP